MNDSKLRSRGTYLAFIYLILITVGIVYATVYKYTGIGIPCVFHLITGLKCPGCGVTRMLCSLLMLDFSKAFSYNPFLLITSPFVVFVVINISYHYVYGGRQSKVLNVALLLYVVSLIVFGILRNIL